MSTYCDSATGHPFHGPYHNQEYGFPLREDHLLFERLVLEINQAGLSWLTILKKRITSGEPLRGLIWIELQPLAKLTGVGYYKMPASSAIDLRLTLSLKMLAVWSSYELSTALLRPGSTATIPCQKKTGSNSSSRPSSSPAVRSPVSS